MTQVSRKLIVVSDTNYNLLREFGASKESFDNILTKLLKKAAVSSSSTDSDGDSKT